jgi:hypothetical protein
MTQPPTSAKLETAYTDAPRRRAPLNGSKLFPDGVT